MDALENVSSWRLFLALARTGSLSPAAALEGCTLPAASRTIARLERALGFPILDRTRRPASLTPRAKELLPAARDFVRAAEALHSAGVRGERQASLRGRFRISLPAGCGRSTYFALLRRLETENPGFSAEILPECGPEGLLTGQADLALMPCRPDPGQLAVFPCGLEYTLLLAAPSYLQRRGRPASIGELARHTVLLQSATSPGFSTRLERGRSVAYLAPSQPCRQGDALFCRSMLLQGEGIALDVGLGALEDELACGRVVPVLEGWHREPWRSAVVCRLRDASRPAFAGLARILSDHAEKTAAERWKRWYAHFGFEDAVAPAADGGPGGPPGV